MRFDIITIFPEFFRAVVDCGILRRARNAGLVEITAHDLRQWTTDKHHVVDDRPFGGGDGVVLLSAQGQVFSQALAQEIAQDAAHVILICGRYEGVDERVAEALITDEISIGDYVLSGGEPAAIVVVDAAIRLLPGALGSETSATTESFSDGLLDYPHYTRPTEFGGLQV